MTTSEGLADTMGHDGKDHASGQTVKQTGESGEDVIALMELLFFAYRDFTAGPDAILAEIGFGRAHHRIIHFIGRNPGLRISQLLEILGITKQSLGRVLRELIERGYVYQQEGAQDRRQRLLFLTRKGKALHERLSAPQIARVSQAMAQAGPDAAGAFARTLMGMVDPAQRPLVQQLTRKRKDTGDNG